jgi:cytochrome P450
MALDARDPLPVEARQLRHLPGRPGLPWLGQTLDFLRDPLAFAREQHQRFGPISRGRFLYSARVFLTHPDGNEALLLDRGQHFSARLGWNTVLGELFPRGLMLRDGEDHRLHRRLMQPAFRAEALAGYLARMNPRIAQALHGWGREPHFHFYPAIKRLTLDIAAEVFLGLELRAEIEAVNRDFSDLVEASAAVVRLRGLGRRWTRGLDGRARLVRLIAERIPDRRRKPGADLFSQLCSAEDEQGRRYADDEIVDHLIFVMMAAHDTTTSALTTLAYALARHPDWQQRLGEQARARPGAIDADGVKAAEDSGWALREALRLYPPLTTMVRQLIKPLVLHGHTLPVGASCAIFPVWTQRDPQWWSAPDRFDPERFSPARQEHRRHPFAWAPFGGGAHMCLGLHFAEMQVKAVLHLLLQRYTLHLPPGYQLPYQLAPIAKPRDGLPMRLTPLAN